MVLVVSPLVALMADQVGSLRRRGVACAIMSDHDGVDKSLLVAEKDLSKYSLQCLQPYVFVRISTDFLLLIRMYGSHTSPYGNSALSELTYATHRVVCTYIRTIDRALVNAAALWPAHR